MTTDWKRFNGQEAVNLDILNTQSSTNYLRVLILEHAHSNMPALG